MTTILGRAVRALATLVAVVAAVVIAGASGGGVAVAADLAVYISDLPPFSMPGDLDKPGFNVELVREMVKRANVPATLTPVPWPRAQLTTISTPDSLIVGLSRTVERDGNYQWIAPLIDVDTVFLTVKPNAPVMSLDEARKLTRITVRDKTPFQEMLNANGVAGVEAVQSEESNARKLQAGRVDAWLTYDLRGLFVWQSLGFSPAELVYGRPIGTERLYLAGHRDIPAETAERLRNALAAMRDDGTYRRIHDRYFAGLAKGS